MGRSVCIALSQRGCAPCFSDSQSGVLRSCRFHSANAPNHLLNAIESQVELQHNKRFPGNVAVSDGHDLQSTRHVHNGVRVPGVSLQYQTYTEDDVSSGVKYSTKTKTVGVGISAPCGVADATCGIGPQVAHESAQYEGGNDVKVSTSRTVLQGTARLSDRQGSASIRIPGTGVDIERVHTQRTVNGRPPVAPRRVKIPGGVRNDRVTQRQHTTRYSSGGMSREASRSDRVVETGDYDQRTHRQAVVGRRGGNWQQSNVHRAEAGEFTELRHHSSKTGARAGPAPTIELSDIPASNVEAGAHRDSNCKFGEAETKRFTRKSKGKSSVGVEQKSFFGHGSRRTRGGKTEHTKDTGKFRRQRLEKHKSKWGEGKRTTHVARIGSGSQTKVNGRTTRSVERQRVAVTSTASSETRSWKGKSTKTMSLKAGAATSTMSSGDAHYHNVNLSCGQYVLTDTSAGLLYDTTTTTAKAIVQRSEGDVRTLQMGPGSTTTSYKPSKHVVVRGCVDAALGRYRSFFVLPCVPTGWSIRSRIDYRRRCG